MEDLMSYNHAYDTSAHGMGIRSLAVSNPAGFTHGQTISLVLAHPERGAVNETDSGTLAQQDFLDEDGQWNGNLLFLLSVV